MTASRFGALSFCALLTVLGGARLATAEVQAEHLSFAQVERIALERVPSGQIDEIERDTIGGRAVFEVEMREAEHAYALIIDAVDGHIVSARLDD